MRFHNLTKVTCLLALAAVSTGSVWGAAPAIEKCTCPPAAEWSFPSEASQLLKEIRAASYRLTERAERLRSFSHGISWQTHAGELTQVREHVNEIGARIERLRSIQHALEPWQQEALDSVAKAGISLAAGTESAIRHLNDNRNHLWSDIYRGHLTTVSTGADQMKRSIAVHLDLADARDRVEMLQEQAAGLGS